MSDMLRPANKIGPKYAITSSVLTDYFEANALQQELHSIARENFKLVLNLH